MEVISYSEHLKWVENVKFSIHNIAPDRMETNELVESLAGFYSTRVWEKGLSNPYHNYAHLNKVFDTVSKDGCSPVTKVAALYHDFGYDPKSSTNIEVAVQAVTKDLNHCKVEQDLINEVVSIIESTETFDFSYHEGSIKLVKADLQALYTDKKTYYSYRKAIREEYKHVPRKVYLQKRLQVMKTLIDSCFYKLGIDSSLVHLEIGSLYDSLSEFDREIPKKVLYAGTFDPFHKGHLSVIRDIESKGYAVVVAVMDNPSKDPIISSEDRSKLIKHDLHKWGSKAEVFVRSGSGIVETMHKLRCVALARGYRDNDASSFNEENNRATLLKSETGINTILVKTTGLVSTYSSSSAKNLLSRRYPTSMLSSITRTKYCDVMHKKVTLSIVAGGIATGKTRWRGPHGIGTHGSATIDLDVVAKEALNNHPDHMFDTYDDRIKNFKSYKKYKKYMDKIRPIIMAGLYSTIEEFSREEGLCYICIQVNKLGLLNKDLLELCGYNIHCTEDIDDETAIERVKKRGSSLETLRIIRNLEKHAPSLEDIKKIIRDETKLIKKFDINLDYSGQYELRVGGKGIDVWYQKKNSAS
jgi:pantetheine-phosphate adenylyltransferase